MSNIEELRQQAMQLTKLEAVNLIVKLQNERDFFKKKMDVAVDLAQTNQIVKLQHENKRLKEVAEQSQDGINALFLLECIDHVYDSLGLNADFPVWQERVKAVREFDFKDLCGARTDIPTLLSALSEYREALEIAHNEIEATMLAVVKTCLYCSRPLSDGICVAHGYALKSEAIEAINKAIQFDPTQKEKVDR